MSNFKEMASLEQLRSRWETDEGKQKKKEVIEILKESKKLSITDIDQRFLATYNEIKSHLEGFDYTDEIKQADLRGINLENRKDLYQVYLRNVDLSGANCKGTNFSDANFKYVILKSTDLSGSNLNYIKMDGIEVGKYSEKDRFTDFTNSNLMNSDFKDITNDEIVFPKYNLKKNGDYKKAEIAYRFFKNFFKGKGKYKEADRCYRLEMIAKRKQNGKTYQFFDLLIRDLTCGYGMRPWNVFGWIFALIIIFGFFYSFFDSQFIYSGDLATHFSLGKALYFSTVTFTTLGFGDWHPNPNSLIKFLVAFEALIGFIFLTLWIVTLARKIIRE